MFLNTSYHGQKEYNEEDIIIFEKGLPGFEDNKKYIIFELEDNEFFNILHSVDDPTLGFIVVSPFSVVENYELVLNDDKIMELQVEKPEDVLLMNIVTLNSSIENITVNLQAPIVINIKCKLGEQIIIAGDKYSVRSPLVKK